MENCGDVNMDGKDEILTVVQHDDMSNLNEAHVYTFSNKEWQEIFTIPVWEWQFPPTPSASTVPGMFGNYEYATIQDDSINVLLENQLKAFKFIQHHPDHSVEFRGRNLACIGYDYEAKAEYDSLGDKAYIKRYFKKVYLYDSLYLQDVKNGAVCYKASEIEIEKENVIIFNLDDCGEMVTTRIYTNRSGSPFRRK
jgi:hypothetical protein